MEEINLKDLWNYFISKIMIIVALFIAAILGSCIYSLWIQTPLYRSSTTIVLTRSSDQLGENTGITQSDITMNQKLVSTYREIIKSRRILNKVITNLNLEVNAKELQRQITVTNEKDTELIKISVINEDAKLAQKIADEIARVFNIEIVDIYSIKNVSVIDYAEEEINPYNVNVLKQTTLAAIIGIVLACAIIFVMFYFDTTIKNAEEIEEKLGLPILGRVPVRTKGGMK